jgi:hypothetical protein
MQVFGSVLEDICIPKLIQEAGDKNQQEEGMGSEADKRFP